jgi:hypothetical protein
MGQRPPGEAKSHSASQKIPRLLRNPKVYYRVHNSLPLDPILSQLNPIYAPTLYFFKTHVNAIYSFTLISYNRASSLQVLQLK